MSNNRYSLPDTITSDQELINWCNKYVPGFITVISRTDFANLYPRMKNGESIIINLDPKYKHGGTHWVALRVSNEAPIVYYKDSFGAPPPDDIVKVILNNNVIRRGLVYGNRINQGIKEQNCGKRAAYFLQNISNSAKRGKEIEYFESTEI